MKVTDLRPRHIYYDNSLDVCVRFICLDDVYRFEDLSTCDEVIYTERDVKKYIEEID